MGGRVHRAFSVVPHHQEVDLAVSEQTYLRGGHEAVQGGGQDNVVVVFGDN